MEKDNFEKIFVVMPFYNEEKVINDVINEIKSAGFSNIIAVDDGSSDNAFEKIKNVSGVTALKHKINRGKGAATKTGIEAAKLLGAEIIVTMDADGQHDPGDIARLIEPIEKNHCDVVLGTRLKNPVGMPRYKIWQNKIGNLVTWFFYGLYVSDSQSG